MNVLITGGASGLGEAITRLIASKPEFKIYFTYANSKDRALKIEENFSNVTSIKCDFNVDEEVNRLVDSLPNLDIDILINNAYNGQFLDSYFHKTNENDFLGSFRVNILPTIKITQASISIFRKKKFGKIITVLTAALVNNPPIGSSIYVANKAYLMQLSKIWATENIKFNICANTVSPAFMLTKFTESIDDRIVEQIVATHPLKRLLTTNEVAESVLFLINSNQHVNGIDLLINSGVNIK
ncbi:SDR family NAD(P)-dependent oxidoreductase [Pedobacter cryotolerans]|uniref:SDR family oxidoreductase n=1 Tax=Pedobacter cryotolerans TaxID=2571270 RepID=A0A4U1C1Z3_9SPHI|nr:SDR family oxidoreductase [Pedobacter cryotolerans]TKB99656.1 SDR family oxidoreductase [Pedobacter cryotolerans]